MVSCIKHSRETTRNTNVGKLQGTLTMKSQNSSRVQRSDPVSVSFIEVLGSFPAL